MYNFTAHLTGRCPHRSAFPVWIRWGIWVSPTYYAMANLVIRGFIDEGNDNTESITNGVGFRNDISYGSIAPPVTYVLFAAFIILMKAATVFAMRGLKQAK